MLEFLSYLLKDIPKDLFELIKDIVLAIIQLLHSYFNFCYETLQIDAIRQSFANKQWETLEILLLQDLFGLIIVGIPGFIIGFVLFFLLTLILTGLLRVTVPIYCGIRRRFGLYAYNKRYLKWLEKRKVALILEPNKDIYIKTEKDAISVLYRLMNFNKYFTKLALFRELSMILLLDEHDKLLAAVIDSVGEIERYNIVEYRHLVRTNYEDVVYSYNASFGDCAQVVIAHTHPPKDGNEIYHGIYSKRSEVKIYPSMEDLALDLETMRKLEPVKVKFSFILPGIINGKYRVINLEKLKYLYEKRGGLDDIDKDEVSITENVGKFKKLLKSMPAENFDVVYDATEKDESLDPTLVGIKLKYKKLPQRIKNQAEGLKKWVEQQQQKSLKS